MSPARGERNSELELEDEGAPPTPPHWGAAGDDAGVRGDGVGRARISGRSSTDHPGPDGPPPVQTRIWGAGPGPGAGPDQVFRARSRGFRALGREFFLRVLNEIFWPPQKFFTRHTHWSRPGPDLVQTLVQTQPNRPKRSRLPEKLKS